MADTETTSTEPQARHVLYCGGKPFLEIILYRNLR